MTTLAGQTYLWGVDSHGELIILEAKTCGRPADPFQALLRSARHNPVGESERDAGVHPPETLGTPVREEGEVPDGMRARRAAGRIAPRLV